MVLYINDEPLEERYNHRMIKLSSINAQLIVQGRDIMTSIWGQHLSMRSNFVITTELQDVQIVIPTLFISLTP